MSASTGPSGARGLTLLEVLIAGSILTMVLANTAMLMGFAFERSGDARLSAAAERIAASHLETLLYEHKHGGIADSGRVIFDATGRVDPRGQFVSSWVLEPDRPMVGASRLAVTVAWVGQRPRTQRVVTYLVAEEP